MLGEQILKDGDKEYRLRLTFASTKNIEDVIPSNTLLHLNSLSWTQMTVALAETAQIDKDKAYEIIKRIGIEIVSVKIKSLILETYNPEKKPVQAAKKQKS